MGWARLHRLRQLDCCPAPLLPNLRPTLRTISLRLPEAMIGHLKVLANKRDVPYQSLLKLFLAERLQRELAKGA